MSLESSIGDLVEQASKLMDLPQIIATTANAQIDKIGATYDKWLATGIVRQYVSAVAGDNKNDGLTIDKPVKTMAEAARRIPYGGVGTILLDGDYHVDADVLVANKRLAIMSANSLKPRLTFERYTHVTGATTFRAMRGFYGENGLVSFHSCVIKVPPLDGNWTALTPSNFATIVKPTGSTVSGLLGVTFTLCDLDIPATPFGPIVGNGGTSLVFLHGYGLSTIDQPYLGKLYFDATSSAGTDPKNVRSIFTNLPLI